MKIAGSQTVAIWASALVTVMLCVTGTHAQSAPPSALGRPHEIQRRLNLNGEVSAGYEGIRDMGTSYTSPFVGLNADLAGFLLHPQILNFDIRPNLTFGQHWLGPSLGPSGNGVNARTTFLGASPIPLTISYSHQNVGSPSISVPSAELFPGTSYVDQVFAVDWAARFKKLPVFMLHYSRNSNTVDLPAAFGPSNTAQSSFLQLGTEYTIAKWQLKAGYSRTGLTNPVWNWGTGTTTQLKDHSNENELSASASRPLPFRSFITIDANHHNYNIESGSTTIDSSYSRASVALRSEITKRIALNVNSTYVSNAGSYLLEKALTGNASNTQGVPLLNVGYGSILTGGAGLQVHVTKGLTANAQANTVKTLTGTSQFNGNGYGAGLGYTRKLFRGDFTTAYSFNTLKSFGAFDQRTRNHTISGTYSRALSPTLRLVSSGFYNQGQMHLVNDYTLRTYGANFEVTRPISSWRVSARFDLQKNINEYPIRNEFLTKGIGLSATSRRYQIAYTHNFNSGLAYRFGFGLVPVPDTTSWNSDLFPLVLTSGSSDGLNVTARLRRRLSVRGQWQKIHRSVNTGELSDSHYWDFRFDYDFRKLRMSAGYRQQTQSISISSFDMSRKQFYLQFSRKFDLF